MAVSRVVAGRTTPQQKRPYAKTFVSLGGVSQASYTGALAVKPCTMVTLPRKYTCSSVLSHKRGDTLIHSVHRMGRPLERVRSGRCAVADVLQQKKISLVNRFVDSFVNYNTHVSCCFY